MKHSNKRAFTLVELLVVMVLISILFVVLISKVDFSSDAARQSGVETDFRSYEIAATSVGLQYGGFTSDYKELANRLNKKLDSQLQIQVKGGQLLSAYEDPWGNKLEITYSQPVEANGELRFVCAGKDRSFSTKDDIILVVRYDTSTGRGEIMTEHPKNSASHTHLFNKEVIQDKYLYKEANCSSAAKYFYSCECGDANRVVFLAGEVNPDKHSDPIREFVWLSTQKHVMSRKCPDCGFAIEQIDEYHAKTSDGKACTLCGSTDVGYVGPGGEGVVVPLPNPKDSLNDYTWAELKRIAKENLTKSELSSTYHINVGDTKTSNGVVYTLVDTDGNEYDGFVFMYNSFLSGSMNSNGSNIGGYASSELAARVEAMYQNLADPELKAVIKSVDLRSNDGLSSPDSLHVYNAHLFLPSAKEVGCPVTGGQYENEGTKFDYFTDNASRSMIGEATMWWLRTAYSASNYNYYYITSEGHMGTDTANIAFNSIVVFVIG